MSKGVRSFVSREEAAAAGAARDEELDKLHAERAAAVKGAGLLIEAFMVQHQTQKTYMPLVTLSLAYPDGVRVELARMTPTDALKHAAGVADAVQVAERAADEKNAGAPPVDPLAGELVPPTTEGKPN